LEELELNRTEGITLIEVVFTLAILLFILTAIAKGIMEYQKARKRAQLFNTGRILLEKIRSEIESKSANYFSGITNFYQENATCNLNGTCSFDTEDCYKNPQYNNTGCLLGFKCVYCLQGDRLVANDTGSCSSGYQFNVGFNVSKLVSPEISGIILGYGFCVTVSFRDPLTNQTKEYRTPVILKTW
jgi:type II secretory pathway pseudopilin PulG